MAFAQQMTTSGFFANLTQAEYIDTRNREIDVPPPPDEPQLFTLTIELVGAKPRIWRRVSLPGDLTLDAVHTLFQAAMGWTDSHLHRFHPGAGNGYDQPYFITEFDEVDGDEGTREENVRLDQVLREPGDRLTYLYDFGDDWLHRVKLESTSPLTPENREPTCLRGAKACPPEDVGGIYGFQEVAAWLRAGAPADAVPPPFDDAEHAHGWLPPDYDPDAFDAAEATAAMRMWAAGEHLPWHSLPEPLTELILNVRGAGWVQVDTWLNALDPRLPQVLNDDDVRCAARPWLAVLDAVGSGVKLTAAGYLPPAMVERIAADAGVTDWWIGKANREDLTWPVADLRSNAQEVGLLRKAKGTLAPTARARAVASDPRALVTTVLGRMPLGKGFDAEAGWFALLGLAAGYTGTTLNAALAQILTDRGWQAEGSSRISGAQASSGARPTFKTLEIMAGGFKDLDPELLTRLARAALFGVAAPM